MGLALLQVMRNGLLRRSEAAAAPGGDVEVHEDGSGRLHVVRSKTDQAAAWSVSTWARRPWRPCWPSGPRRRIDPGASVFGL